MSRDGPTEMDLIMTDESVAFGFASALADWKADEPEVTARCRDLLIDGLATASAGAAERGPTLMADLAREEAARPVATVIGQGFATSPASAARINGMALHVLDFEPMWNPPNHAVSTTLPAILALAEKLEAEGAPPQGEALLRAFAKGIEAQGRLRVASQQLEPGLLLFHPPGVVGPLAAAVACATLLGLDREQTATAINIAASRASGLIANIGSMTKALHCGDAAMRGLEAALLARSGFTADRDAVGGPRGYGRAYFGDAFLPEGLVEKVRVPRVVSPGMAWKLFPSQYATHFVITAALDCAREIPDPAAIRRVTVTTPPMAYVDRPRPDSGLAGKFSFQYGCAAALLDRRVDIDSFTDRRRFAADMVAMLERIALRQDATISGRLDAMHVDVEIELADGRRVSKRCDAPEGSWSRPVGSPRIHEKARSLLDRTLGPQRSAGFWAEVAKPDRDLRIATVMEVLRAPAP